MNDPIPRRAVYHHTCSILRSWLHNRPLDAETVAFCTEENLNDIYALVKRYDLAHLAALALDKSDLPKNAVTKQFSATKMQAIYRHALMDLEFEKICNILEQMKVPYVPLKGAVLRRYYPEPWMRTSCDIDILVPENQLEKASSALVSHGWIIRGGKQYHDISLYSPSGVHLELHFHVKMHSPNADPILESVWQHCTPTSENRYVHCLSNAFLLFHHLAHMSCHIIEGGCGIRPFLDLWLMLRHLQYDHQEFQTLCANADLERFYLTAAELSRVWFDGQPHSPLTLQLESYILTGGVYGSASHRITLHQTQVSNRWIGMLHHFFVPQRIIIAYFPIAQNHRWMIPFLQVARWFCLLSPKKIRSSLRKFRYIHQLSPEDLSNTEDFLAQLGLKFHP